MAHHSVTGQHKQYVKRRGIRDCRLGASDSEDTSKAGHSRRERSSPFRAHSSNFQSIHLGWSFIEVPCKPHNRALQSPRNTVHTAPPAFKTGSHSPFCGFCFCERGSLSPYPRSYFSFMVQMRRMENGTE
ncbi:hypothetical protein AVEN_28038-1 [Araneus ventricosus]|uniref:Uncharacterized protein n=1 Tax=Araneus ventricosus TaxID=182803 RepID=A0A4Y2BGS6_ARAVE|nr:hypothetical protein AVEN_28038-1 [Araneus ventricosus]